MSELNLDIWIVCRSLEEPWLLGEVLRFPEVDRMGGRAAKVVDALRKSVRPVLDGGQLREFARRAPPASPALASLRVEVPPPRRSPAWTEPVSLRLGLVAWDDPSGTRCVRIPALGAEVVVTGARDLDPLLEEHVRLALARTKVANDLVALARIDRQRPLTLQSTSVNVALASTIERWREDRTNPSDPALEAVADRISPPRGTPAAYGAEATLGDLADLLRPPRPGSVLLVGPSGVGKTALVDELARRARDLGLKGVEFHRSGGARLVAGPKGGDTWQERCRNLVKELGGQAHVLHLGSLVELAQVGRAHEGDVGVGAFLRPAIERGELRVVVECTPEELDLLEREEPQLLRAFERLELSEPDDEAGRAVLTQAAADACRHRQAPSPQALAVLDRLHRRFATASARPGRTLAFLEELLRDFPHSRAPGPGDVTAHFSSQTGLPQFLVDDDEPLDLAATSDFLTQRVRGQGAAVETLVDVLASVKADLGRPQRPLASLLFVGPTGVGKTELAKSLAELLFGDRDRLTRFDMSEYQDPLAVTRLVGGVFGSEGLLTGKVRSQPFNVLLLDEAEKAHPDFFDLMLQVLGEARLTDAGGRLADFRNTVVILTSNLGARGFSRRAPGFGQGAPGGGEARRHFERAVAEFFRPELVNRFDAVVPFLPLDQAALRDVTRRALDELMARPGLRDRPVSVDWDDAVIDWLAARGYDPRYGARPLRRALARDVLAPLAAALNQQAPDRVLEATLRLDQGALAVDVVAVDERLQAQRRKQAKGHNELAWAATRVRRRVEALTRSSVAVRTRHEVERLVEREPRLRAAVSRGRGKSRELEEARSQLGKLRPWLQGADKLQEDAYRVEGETRVLLLAGASDQEDPEALSAEVDRLLVARKDARLALLSFYHRRDPEAALCVWSKDRHALRAVTPDHWGWLKQHAEEATLRTIVAAPEPREKGAPPFVPGAQLKNPEALSGVKDEVFGLVFLVKFPDARFFLQAEDGVHLVVDSDGRRRALLETNDPDASAWAVPYELLQGQDFGHRSVTRRTLVTTREFGDSMLEGTRRWRGQNRPEVFAALLEDRREVYLERLLTR